MGSLPVGPLYYLLIIWGCIFALFLGMLLYRSLLENREDDQLFLDAGEERMAQEQRQLVARIGSLSKPILTTGIASGVLLVVIAGMWLYEGLKNF